MSRRTIPTPRSSRAAGAPRGTHADLPARLAAAVRGRRLGERLVRLGVGELVLGLTEPAEQVGQLGQERVRLLAREVALVDEPGSLFAHARVAVCSAAAVWPPLRTAVRAAAPRRPRRSCELALEGEMPVVRRPLPDVLELGGELLGRNEVLLGAGSGPAPPRRARGRAPASSLAGVPLVSGPDRRPVLEHLRPDPGDPAESLDAGDVEDDLVAGSNSSAWRRRRSLKPITSKPRSTLIRKFSSDPVRIQVFLRCVHGAASARRFPGAVQVLDVVAGALGVQRRDVPGARLGSTRARLVKSAWPVVSG